MISSPSSVSVDAGSGGVTLTLPNDFGAEVDIETGSGSITRDFAVRTRTVERRRLRGTIGNGAARVVVVETGIRIRPLAPVGYVVERSRHARNSTGKNQSLVKGGHHVPARVKDPCNADSGAVEIVKQQVLANGETHHAEPNLGRSRAI
ncbi:DUF4097 family beta strand repeat-containing protein [Gemmatimonas sp.]|uniref:DUF4097 family beta strand repeat-containing protein n=1 Tax=Gemmatimonas sp. TaxID=1962908 RepID=UPI0035655FAF